jgi:hypothetical protein
MVGSSMKSAAQGLVTGHLSTWFASFNTTVALYCDLVSHKTPAGTIQQVKGDQKQRICETLGIQQSLFFHHT